MKFFKYFGTHHFVRMKMSMSSIGDGGIKSKLADIEMKSTGSAQFSVNHDNGRQAMEHKSKKNFGKKIGFLGLTGDWTLVNRSIEWRSGMRV
jgi:hypothetical protein